MHHEIYLPAWPVLTYMIYILLNTRNKKKQKQKNKQTNNNNKRKESREILEFRILELTLKYPRHARREFRGVLDESFIFVCEIWSEWVFEKLRMLPRIAKYWGDLLLLLFTY